MSELKNKIAEVLKSAMRERNNECLMVLRGVQAAIKQIEVDTRETLDDTRVLAVLEKQMKQRKESIKAYTDAGRIDLADKEQFELNVISQFMPAALSDAELDALVVAEIAAQGASSIRDMGKVMNALRPKISGKADPAIVSGLIKAKLT